MRDLFLVINIAVRIGVAFMGFIHLFAQLFFADFDWSSTAAGLGGMTLATLTGWPHRRGKLLDRIAITGGAFALIGVGVGVYNFYAYYNIPGNHHAWPTTLLYVAGIAYLIIAAIRGQTLR